MEIPDLLLSVELVGTLLWNRLERKHSDTQMSPCIWGNGCLNECLFLT